MDIRMLRPLMAAIAGFYGFYFTVLLLFVRNEILLRERKTQWVRSLVHAES